MELLGKLVKCFNLENINLDKLYRKIIINASLVKIRKGNWKIFNIPLVCMNTLNLNIKCHQANFIEANEWGYKSPKSVYKIIHNERHLLWIGDLHSEQPYFIKKNDVLFALTYKHKTITIRKNIDDNYKNLFIDNNSNFDELVNSIDFYHFDSKDEAINLTEYFYKGFFYKGPLFGRDWKKEITILKNVSFFDGLLRIEIKNLTYPHSGYVLLDLDTNKIVDAKKID